MSGRGAFPARLLATLQCISLPCLLHAGKLTDQPDGHFTRFNCEQADSHDSPHGLESAMCWCAGFNPPDVDIMQKPPRNPKDEQLITPWVFLRCAVTSASGWL